MSPLILTSESHAKIHVPEKKRRFCVCVFYHFSCEGESRMRVICRITESTPRIVVVTLTLSDDDQTYITYFLIIDDVEIKMCAGHAQVNLKY